jgi:hypothetical protein
MINRLVLILMIPFAVVQSAYAGGKEDFNPLCQDRCRLF